MNEEEFNEKYNKKKNEELIHEINKHYKDSSSNIEAKLKNLKDTIDENKKR